LEVVEVVALRFLVQVMLVAVVAVDFCKETFLVLPQVQPTL
jgi:hypothetical protein